MKVLLVIPPKAAKNVFHIVPPLGLGYLSASLKKHKIKVELVDCVKDHLNHDLFSERVAKISPDIVGYQVFTSDVRSVSEAIERVKAIDPNIVNVVGGYHPSAAPEMTMERHFPRADFGFVGQAEIEFAKFVKYLETGQGRFEDIGGLLWRRNEKIAINPQHFHHNLDELGMPDWDLINPLEYQKTLSTIMVKATPFAPMIATRGCPYRCTFCSGYKINGRKVRSRSAKNLLAEMDYLHNIYGIREFQMLDDNFTWNRDFVIELCDLLISGKRNYYFSFPNGIRLDTLDRELCLKMKAAGCYSICVGIESGSDRILKMIKKHLTVSEIKEKIKVIREVGLPVTGTFILGFPGETREDMRKTEQLLMSTDLFAAHIFMFHPFPGTEAFDQLVESGKLDDKFLGYEADHSSLADCVYSPEGISMQELRRIHRRLNRAFYLRPKRIWKILLTLKSPRVLFYFLKRAFSYLF
jgi:anaerobic magnesium-protoporphyrin IX monomethyl ester cyclase